MQKTLEDNYKNEFTMIKITQTDIKQSDDNYH